jgi:hypothetical protein
LERAAVSRQWLPLVLSLAARRPEVRALAL